MYLTYINNKLLNGKANNVSGMFDTRTRGTQILGPPFCVVDVPLLIRCRDWLHSKSRFYSLWLWSQIFFFWSLSLVPSRNTFLPYSFLDVLPVRRCSPTIKWREKVTHCHWFWVNPPKEQRESPGHWQTETKSNRDVHCYCYSTKEPSYTTTSNQGRLTHREDGGNSIPGEPRTPSRELTHPFHWVNSIKHESQYKMTDIIYSKIINQTVRKNRGPFTVFG